MRSRQLSKHIMRLSGSSAFAALSALACLVGRANADLKGVFAHYLVSRMRLHLFVKR